MMPPCSDHRLQEEFVVVLLQEGSGRDPVGAVRSHKAPHSLDEPLNMNETGSQTCPRSRTDSAHYSGTNFASVEQSAMRGFA